MTGREIRPPVPPVDEHQLWRAWLAPYGVMSDDGRAVLAGEDRFALPRVGFAATIDHAYVLRTEAAAPEVRVGRAEQLQPVDGWLTAVCRVWDPEALRLLAAQVYVPEFSLTDYDSSADVDHDYTAGTLTFRRGIVAGIRLGHNPVWPGCRFTQEEAHE